MKDLQKKLTAFFKEFKKIGPKEKVFIFIILICSFITGIIIPPFWKNLISPSQINNTSSLVSPTPLPLPATVSVITDKYDIRHGGTFSAIIKVNSPNQGVEAADFALNFDPNYLKVATISSGNYFGNYPIQKVEDNTVKISGIAQLLNNRFIIPKGEGIVVSIAFEAKEATSSTTLTFDREKTIVASGGKNILEKINDFTVNIR